MRKISLLCAPLLLASSFVLAHDEATEDPNVWSGKLKSGFSGEWGNTRCIDTSSSFEVKRSTTPEGAEHPDCELIFSGWQKYKRKKNTITDNEAWLKAKYRRYIDEDWSWQLWSNGEYDQIKDLNFGSTNVAGVRYRVYNSEKFTLHVDGGLGVGFKLYEAGKSPITRRSDDVYPSGAAGFEVHWHVTEMLTASNVFEFTTSLLHLPQNTVDNLFALHLELSKCWGIEVSHLIDFDNRPAEDRQPVPVSKKRFNHEVRASLVYSF